MPVDVVRTPCESVVSARGVQAIATTEMDAPVEAWTSPACRLFPASRTPDRLPSMADISRLHRELIARVLGGDGTAPPELRRAAFDGSGLDEPLRALVDKVAHDAQQVTDEDIAAVRAAGLSEDQIFEIVVCAAIGQADRQYAGALAALRAATGDSI